MIILHGPCFCLPTAWSPIALPCRCLYWELLLMYYRYKGPFLLPALPEFFCHCLRLAEWLTMTDRQETFFFVGATAPSKANLIHVLLLVSYYDEMNLGVETQTKKKSVVHGGILSLFSPFFFCVLCPWCFLFLHPLCNCIKCLLLFWRLEGTNASLKCQGTSFFVWHVCRATSCVIL